LRIRVILWHEIICDITAAMHKRVPNHTSQHMKNKGFTLIELSIVLVIVGLIVAGVMAGQSIIRSAKLRSVITEVNGLPPDNFF